MKYVKIFACPFVQTDCITGIDPLEPVKPGLFEPFSCCRLRFFEEGKNEYYALFMQGGSEEARRAVGKIAFPLDKFELLWYDIYNIMNEKMKRTDVGGRKRSEGA